MTPMTAAKIISKLVGLSPPAPFLALANALIAEATKITHENGTDTDTDKAIENTIDCFVKEVSSRRSPELIPSGNAIAARQDSYLIFENKAEPGFWLHNIIAWQPCRDDDDSIVFYPVAENGNMYSWDDEYLVGSAIAGIVKLDSEDGETMCTSYIDFESPAGYGSIGGNIVATAENIRHNEQQGSAGSAAEKEAVQ